MYTRRCVCVRCATLMALEFFDRAPSVGASLRRRGTIETEGAPTPTHTRPNRECRGYTRAVCTDSYRRHRTTLLDEDERRSRAARRRSSPSKGHQTPRRHEQQRHSEVHGACSCAHSMLFCSVVPVAYECEFVVDLRPRLVHPRAAARSSRSSTRAHAYST
jgi:hypothetical protein